MPTQTRGVDYFESCQQCYANYDYGDPGLALVAPLLVAFALFVVCKVADVFIARDIRKLERMGRPDYGSDDPS